MNIRTLGHDDAPRLAPLVALYAGALLGREPAAPDEDYVRSLLAEPVVEVAAAELEGRLVGFALYYDLPEAISGKRAGQLDDLFVAPEARGAGIAQELMRHIVEEGRGRGWIHLRWMVPEASPAAALYDRIAERAPWRNYVIRIDESMRW
ncbi:GNAT family N-acetyltransferase [Hansschlegelia zhihuaiae]|uniref:GNAT family N-acetyltransferase n=1 Tax=Hansschlegelia zhihuaiae TaxID=405005 RepID=A0A4Q0MIZ1_9HYPH|nr:GNAT family N-acetyltransferase [Hansschlegelia zhihuaiae]RXF73333.1 GNAT family N-acetyltransferase [Hansschlegelia zhihuaiae]